MIILNPHFDSMLSGHINNSYASYNICHILPSTNSNHISFTGNGLEGQSECIMFVFKTHHIILGIFIWWGICWTIQTSIIFVIKLESGNDALFQLIQWILIPTQVYIHTKIWSSDGTMEPKYMYVSNTEYILQFFFFFLKK